MRAACDVVTPLAERVGAVNTFWMDDYGRLNGDNTDVGGFTTAVETLLGAPPRDLTIGLLGAGGAAAGVLAAVEAWPGCRRSRLQPNAGARATLCERFGSIAQPVDDIGAIAGAQLVVNATSIGLRDDSFPMDPSHDRARERGRSTSCTAAARPRGFAPFARGGRRAADGIVMLVEQGALAFERWFGVAPDRAAMWEAIGAAGV